MIESLAHLPEPKRTLLTDLVAQLQLPGVAALVLGGSYASKTHHATSDLDVALYYFEAAPFSLADIRRVAEAVSADGSPTVTGFYEWGAWVNGGAWIHTPHGKVDFLYRNLDHVRRTITEAEQGVMHHDYDQQPAYGFYSVIYLAETQICIPLYDPEGYLAALKRRVATYPPKLKQKILADSLWSAEFTLLHAQNFAAQADIYNTVGCLTRAASNLTQALFALNERYFLRDKKVMETVAGFALLPSGYVEEVNRLLASPGSTGAALTKTVDELGEVWRAVVALPGVGYAAKFQV